jgi:predicted TIM-barrel fold metal-dependent hydrolase
VREFVRAETFRILEDRRLPIFIDFGANPAGGIDDTDWEALRFLLAAHPKLPVILCEFRMRGGSRLVPGVMDDHPNLHLETSGLWNYMSLEHIARNWGAERLIFGSRSPWHSVGLAIGMVTMANLPAAQRAMILGGNIRRLMEAAR